MDTVQPCVFMFKVSLYSFMLLKKFRQMFKIFLFSVRFNIPKYPKYA